MNQNHDLNTKLAVLSVSLENQHGKLPYNVLLCRCLCVYHRENSVGPNLSLVLVLVSVFAEEFSNYCRPNKNKKRGCELDRKSIFKGFIYTPKQIYHSNGMGL